MSIRKSWIGIHSKAETDQTRISRSVVCSASLGVRLQDTFHATKMSDDHKHRARIFLHRGDLTQARQCLEQAVADDRASGNQGELSDSLGNLGNTCALLN